MKTHPVIPQTEDDSRLLRAAQEYLAALEAGLRPDRATFLARFPDLAAELGPYLDTLDTVHAARPGLTPLTGKKREPASAELPSEPLGDFRIIGEIGRGGMGVVYEAVQLSLGRRVALKVLPLAAALDAKQLQRFKNEAQAAAQLHHPNIVPVYYVGVERGVHFYAMQFIEGQNLAAVVEEMRATFAPSPSSRYTQVRPGISTEPYTPGELPPPPAETRPLRAGALSTQRSERPADFFRSVARLVAQAATGLAHAHSVGIVHRDIKPANLLVDALGTLWITDFGLAQFHTEGSLTQTGDLLGTLRYMSPEQAGGQRVLIDHRTDIYSLGARTGRDAHPGRAEVRL
jgi:serine/threonine protein kinase